MYPRHVAPAASTEDVLEDRSACTSGNGMEVSMARVMDTMMKIKDNASRVPSHDALGLDA